MRTRTCQNEIKIDSRCKKLQWQGNGKAMAMALELKTTAAMAMALELKATAAMALELKTPLPKHPYQNTLAKTPLPKRHRLAPP